MTIDDEKNKEGHEFNAAQQEAVKIAKALPKALYGDLYDGRSRDDVIGITITKEERDPQYDIPALEESYHGGEDGDVEVDNDVSGDHNNIDYFPPQLKLEDIVEIIKNDADKMSLMVDRGVDPKTTPPKKLEWYLLGSEFGRADTYIHEGKEMPHEAYKNMLVQQYTDLWNEAEEKKISASEILQTRAAMKAQADKQAAEAVRNTIAKIPEKAPQTVAASEETTRPSVPAKIEEAPPTPVPPKKGFFKKLFGGK